MSGALPLPTENPPKNLLTGYSPPKGSYDEMLRPDGGLRPAWVRFAAGLESLGPQGLTQRGEQVRRQLRENGVTYDSYGPSRGPVRPWELDTIPLLFAKADWERLSQGLTQRARLLNAMLADLYGPQRLLKEGVLTPELVFGHAGYLLPCHGIRASQNAFLHLYAAHLARAPDGNWMVLADRTQGPSGTGYAVENRIIISRTLPSDFHSLHVERLASFFISLRERLLSLAPMHRDNPRVVLLTPGPTSNRYFEDAYLARYLGYTLVEGGDLAVRGHRVMLKTLGGLFPVDVILRRTADYDCDPLELRGDSMLGVPGLVQAVRSHEVIMANSLGSGMLEAPALLAYLPAACRLLLQEDLQLGSVPTWWCGTREGLTHVEQNLENLVIRPAFYHWRINPTYGWRLSSAEKSKLLESIRRSPRDFVAQSRIERSTAPVWNGGELRPWRVGLRMYAVASSSGYQVMPGGLARVADSEETFGESLAAGQGSKDVWVLSDAPVSSVTLLRGGVPPVELRRSANDLPSRVADNLLWLGRHVERAEGMVRHLRSSVLRLTSEVEPGGLQELALLVDALCLSGDEPLEMQELDSDTAPQLLQDQVLSFSLDEKEPGALVQTLQSVVRTAAIVRDRISVDSWRIINQLDILNQRESDLSLSAIKRSQRFGDILQILNQMLTLLSAFSGLGMESMTRGPGWLFLDIGRRIERSLHMLRLLRRTLVTVHEVPGSLLEAILEIADSSMTYRYRYLTTLQLAPLLDLLLIDDSNPRSVGFQLQSLSKHMKRLPHESSDPSRNPEQRIVLAAQAALALADVESLCDVASDSKRVHLDNLLLQLTVHLRQLSDSLSHTYLTHTGPSRQMGITSIREELA